MIKANPYSLICHDLFSSYMSFLPHGNDFEIYIKQLFVETYRLWKP